jgi:hypothetical protein
VVVPPSTAEHLRAMPPTRALVRALREGRLHPPDLAAWPSRPGLWDVTAGATDWAARRAEMLDRWETHLLGAMPPRPARLAVEVVQGPTVDGVRRLALLVRWGTGTLRVRVQVPRGQTPGALPVPRGQTPGALPVLLAQASHAAWAAEAVRQGMAAALVSAADGDDDAIDLPSPSSLARRAWALSRALDALAHVEGVDVTRAVVAGHSRNGKAALLAAAFDPRFTAVAASSSGVLGAVPVRLWCDRQGGEGLELLTRHFDDWFAPSLRLWSGFEDRLPTDTHELLACIAPRPVLLVAGERDQVDSLPALGAAVAAARPAWSLLGADPAALVLRRRPGGHTLDPAGVAALVAWARAPRGVAGTPHQVAGTSHPVAGTSHQVADTSHQVPGTSHRVPGTSHQVAGTSRQGSRASHQVPGAPDVAVEVLGTGEPVLWLAGGSPPTGWRPAYEQAEPLVDRLVAAGLQVRTFDPAGTGARQAVLPTWERRLADARAALGDARRVAGFGPGAITAAQLAAADPRVEHALLLAPSAPQAPELAPLLSPRTTVVAPRWDPLLPADLDAACAAAGARLVRLDDWHRLSPALRDVAVAELTAPALA